MQTPKPQIAAILALAVAPLAVAGTSPISSTADSHDALRKRAQEPKDKEPQKQAPKPSMDVQRAVLFELPSVDGEPWNSANFEGKVQVLEWIDPECPMVTRLHSPEGSIRLAANRTQGVEDIEWAAINSSFRGTAQGSEEETKAAKERLLIDYPVLMDGSGWVGRAYGITNAAHVVIIDRKGEIVYSGAPDDGQRGDRISAAIAAALADKPYKAELVPPTGCAVRYSPTITIGSAVPPTTLLWPGSEPTQVSSLRGAPVVLEWFDPSNKDCVEAHKADGALAKAMEFAKTNDAAWVLIDGKETTDKASAKAVEEKAKELGLEVPMATDAGSALRKAFGATATKQVMVLDDHGVLVYRGPYSGGEKKDGLMSILRSLSEEEAK